MKKGDNMYVRLTKELNDVGKLIPANQDISKTITNYNKDYYASVYYYSEEQKKYAEEEVEKTSEKGDTYIRARGVSGILNVTTDKLFFDFDSEDDPELARKDAIETIDRLKALGIPEDNMEVAFSGCKGFAIYVNHDQSLSPSEVKSICSQICQGLKTFDPKMYNASRVFRVTGTKHPKTGLYKTQITIEELRSMHTDDIKDIATTPYFHNTAKRIELPEAIIKMKYFKSKKEDKKTSSSGEFDLDLNDKPRWLSNWKFALSRGFFGSGMRNSALLILAATCKANAFSKTQTYYLLKAAAEEQSLRFNSDKFSKDEIWKTIIEPVYGDNWNGGTFSEDNFPDDLKSFLIESGVPREEVGDNLSMIETADEGFSEFSNYAKDIDKNTMRFGIPSLDKKLKIRKGHLIGLLAPPSIGKCHGKGTKILMFDGTIKNVEDVQVGEFLMGDDSTPRKVLSLARGQEMLYEVEQENGSNYVVNESHILTLKGSSSTDTDRQYKTSRIDDISVLEYLNKGIDYKKRMKGLKVPVEFSKKELELDPYVLGVWLGDGTTSKPEFTIGKQDKEILEYLMFWGDKSNLKIHLKEYESSSDKVYTVTTTGRPNTFRNFLTETKLNEGKHIPHNFLTSDRSDRLKLLAGLLDTDGYLHKGKNVFEISGKCENLMNQVVFLARSLGFRSTVNKENKHYKSFTKGKWYEGYAESYRVHIMGDNTNEIPTLLPRKQTEFIDRRTNQDLTYINLKKMEVGDYYGFTLDGNSRYLLGDFTVTHNTSFAITLANNTSNEGNLVYFASYDMYKNNVYQKLIQRHTGLSEEEIYKAFTTGDVEQIEKFRTILSTEYKNVVFCFKSGQTTDQIKQAIRDVEKQRSQKVDLVIIDYLELVITDKSDPTAASAAAAQGLREIANEGRVVLKLLQPNKVSNKPNVPMTNATSAKGSGSIQQACTSMITLHRPGFHSRLPNEDNFIGLDCVKNRNGGLFSIDFYWHGKTQTFSEIDDVGRVRLENAKRMIKELDNEDDSDDW